MVKFLKKKYVGVGKEWGEVIQGTRKSFQKGPKNYLLPWLHSITPGSSDNMPVVGHITRRAMPLARGKGVCSQAGEP